MVMQFTRQHMSLEQYLLLVNNSDRHYEYYNGEVYLMSLDIEIEVRQLYRRLAIPTMVEQVEEENELKPE